MRWYTCTPVEFGGGPDFFARDSGLLCRGFQSLGIESRAVMPGGFKSGDEPDLIRTEYTNLESAEWWSMHQLDGVVLYSWGSPRFRKVAAAIHQAGIFLVLNQDNGGLVSPLAGWRDWLKEQWILSGAGRGWKSIITFLRSTCKGLSNGLIRSDPLRAYHLKQGNVIACVSPKAAEHYRKLCHHYGGAGLAERVAVIPHAVESRFKYQGREKKRQVACVGRWQDVVQKRPWLLIDVATKLIATDPMVVIEIAGTRDAEMDQWHASLPIADRKRIRLRGKLDRVELAALLEESMVFYSSSAFESFGIAAAEALCSGCSVVAGRSVSMASFEWFTEGDCGCLAARDDGSGHLEALRSELRAWDQGQRDPMAISCLWSERLHADHVARKIQKMSSGTSFQ
jgi:hypothetical protein